MSCLHLPPSKAGFTPRSLSLFPPAEDDSTEGKQKQRPGPRGLSRADLQQLAQGDEDVVEDLAFSDED